MSMIVVFPVLFSILGFLELLFFNMSLPRISKFFSRFHASLQYQLNKNVLEENQEPDSSQPRPSFDDGLCLGREEVEIVMGKVGIFCHSEGGKLQEKLTVNDVSKLFDVQEAKLEEMMSAFDVYDENRDGFIDARELHRVLSALGFVKPYFDMENCKRMISVFDENGDERIDFDEFVNLMSNLD